MKFTLAVLFLISVAANIFAFCGDEPKIETTGRILKELNTKKYKSAVINQSVEHELGLFIKASVKEASWQKRGAEAAVLTVFVDGRYNQDTILFAGGKTFDYQMLLGKYNQDEHRITIVLNQKRSAQGALNVKIESAFSTVFEDLIAAKTVDRSIPAYLAMINAPLIYARADTIDKFSDIPLLTYYEVFDEPESVRRIRYTTIFTNEDGGTQSAALMARWGRMTDIEWVYEMWVRPNGEITKESYQGANHVTQSFQGKRFGSHPLIFDATVNNNFADAGCSSLRLSPNLVQFDLSTGSRETVMDAFPWTYRIMAKEAIRENRVNPQQMGVNTIDDLQNYLYVETYSENHEAAVAIEIKTFDNETSRSDFGDARLRVDRSSYQRIAVRLPSSSTSSLKSLSLICQAMPNAQVSSGCQNTRIIKFIRLDEKYELKIISNPKREGRSLKPNEELTWLLAN